MASKLLTIITLVVASLAGAGQGTASPGDPAIAAISPIDGQAVPASAGGITVTFTCPIYTLRTASDPLPAVSGTAENYSVYLSTGQATDPSDGLLAVPSGVPGRAVERPGQPGVCDAVAGNASDPVTDVPGTLYWQAFRVCQSCASGYEATPPQRVTIAAAGKVTIRAPTAAFAGFAFRVRAGYSGVGASRFVVERRVGSSFVAVATFAGSRGAAVTLPAGRHQIRAVASVGAERVASPLVTVTVRVPRSFTTSRRDDGIYTDPKRTSLRIRVSGGGRRVALERLSLLATCVDPSDSTGTSTTPVLLSIPPVKVAPDGTFLLIRGRTLFSGRLTNRRIMSARVEFTSGVCSAQALPQPRRR